MLSVASCTTKELPVLVSYSIVDVCFMIEFSNSGIL
jgi:hypothetical protein